MLEAGRRQRIMAPKGSLLVAALTAIGFGRPMAKVLAPVSTPAPPIRALPEGYQYRGHCGKQAQARYLRQRFALVCKLRDPASIRALARLHESVLEEPDPGYTTRHLAHVALQAAEGTRTPWAQATNATLDMFEQSGAAHVEARA